MKIKKAFFVGIGGMGVSSVAGIALENGIKVLGYDQTDNYNTQYLKEQGAILNWFDITEREGYFSLNDKISAILKSPRGKLWTAGLILGFFRKMNAVKTAGKKGEKKDGSMSIGPSTIGPMLQMVSGFSVLRLTNMVGMIGVRYTKEELLKMNRQLNRIKKPR